MEFYTPFAVQTAWELGFITLEEAVARLLHWRPPNTLRLRSTHVPVVQLSAHDLATILHQASSADRHADLETLADAVMTPFLRHALAELTDALGAPRFQHGLLQLGLKYLPLRRDPPDAYARFLQAFEAKGAPAVVLNPYDVAIANVPAGLRALRVGTDVHIGVHRDRMPRIIIHNDGSATMSNIGTTLRPFLRIGHMLITDSWIGALPAPPRTFAWSLTPGTLPPDDAAHLALLRAMRDLFVVHAPPAPLPPPVKRQRDLEDHLRLLDAMWRRDTDRALDLIKAGAPLLPPYGVPKCVRAHVYTDRGPKILDVLHDVPEVLPHALEAGMALPLFDAAIWIARRPDDLDCILCHCKLDTDALFQAVLVYCDSHRADEVHIAVVPRLLQHVEVDAAHLALVRTRPDLFRIMYAAVGSPDTLLPLIPRAAHSLVPTLLDLAGDANDDVLQTVFRHPDIARIVAARPHLIARAAPLMNHIVGAGLHEAFAALIAGTTPSPDTMALAIAAESPEIVGCCVRAGCPVAAAHLIPLIEGSEHTLHPMFWPVAQCATEPVLREAFSKSCPPCCFALAVLHAGITDARLMTCVRAAGLYVPDHVT